MNKKVYIFLAVVIALGVFFISRPLSPEKQITLRLQNIKEFVNTHKASTQPLEALKTANHLADYFSNDVVIQHQTKDIKYDFLREKKNLLNSLVLAQKMYDSIKLKWLDIQVTILSDTEAQALVVAEIEIIKDQSSLFKGVIPLEVYFSKINDEWKIVKAFNIDPFE